MRETVAALRSIVTYIVILGYIAVVGPVGLFIGIVFRSKRVLYALGHAGVWLALSVLAVLVYRAMREEGAQLALLGVQIGLVLFLLTTIVLACSRLLLMQLAKGEGKKT